MRCDRYKEIMEKAPEEFNEFASCLDNYGSVLVSVCRQNGSGSSRQQQQ